MQGGQAHDQTGKGAWTLIPALLLGATAACLFGCNQPGPPGASAAPSDPSGYLATPTLTGAARAPDGSLVLAGRGPGDAEIRLQQPDGGAFSATSAEDGAWSMTLPRASAPRMFSFEGEVSGRVVHAEGAVLTLPFPGPPAVLTRAGYGALVIGQKPSDLTIAVVDYDGAGGGAVSGVTLPRAPVRFVLDNRPVGAGEADSGGRYTALDLSARMPMTPGGHSLRVEMQSNGRAAAVEGRWAVTPASALGDAVFRASRDAGAWRVDWRIPGGGVQTTVVFDQPVGVGRS